MQRLVYTLLFLGSMFTSKASHLVGGEITWQSTTNGNYIFELVLYRDCDGIPLPSGSQVINGPNGNIVLNKIPSLGGTIMAKPTGNGCILEKGVYRSAPVSLSGTPPATGWEFSWSDCCRNADQNSAGMGGDGLYLRSKMYPYTPLGAASPLSTSSAYDNSPNFLSGSALVATQGVHQINFQGYDSDQDSLAFTFDQALKAQGSPSAYAPGYSFFFPFPDMSENPLNGPNFMNVHNGIIQIETYNAATGFYKNCIKVASFRNGQLIAEVFKELPLYIDGSVPATPNTSPAIAIDTSLYPSISQIGSTYRITARNSDTINFNILVSDADSAQSFCLNASGLKINSNNLQDSSNCVGGSPCATISPTTNGTYCNSTASSYSFQWHAQCQLLNAGLRGRTSYIFHLSATDNGSPVAKQSFISIIVDLFPSISTPPSFAITGGNTSGSVDFSWSPSQAGPEIPFDGYVIYGNSGVGTPFIPLDTVSNRSQTSTSLNGLTWPAEFFMNQITGSCQVASENSDTISSAPLAQNEFSLIGLALYPQPAKDYIWLANPMGVKLDRAVLLNVNGQRLKEYALDQHASQKIELNFPAGVYILLIEGEKRGFRKRIILE